MKNKNIVELINNQPMTTSLKIAEVFNKDHSKILRDIRNLKCSNEFNEANFGLVEYIDIKGEKRPLYNITKDGFVFLAMGFTGEKACQFKELYIKKFNEMECLLKQKQITELNNTNNDLLTYNLKTRIFNKNKLRYSFVEDIPYFLDADIFELFEMRKPNKTMKDLDIIRKCLNIDKFYLGLTISQIIEIIAHLKNERSSLFLTVLQNNIIPYFDTLSSNNIMINNNSIVRII